MFYVHTTKYIKNILSRSGTFQPHCTYRDVTVRIFISLKAPQQDSKGSKELLNNKGITFTYQHYCIKLPNTVTVC
jgi:hypothetical protein